MRDIRLVSFLSLVLFIVGQSALAEADGVDACPPEGTTGWVDDNSCLEMICELKVDDEGTELHFETYNADPALLDIWYSLYLSFGEAPGD